MEIHLGPLCLMNTIGGSTMPEEKKKPAKKPEVGNGTKKLEGEGKKKTKKSVTKKTKIKGVK